MMAAADCVICCLGPLSADLEGIKLFMKIVIDSKPWLTEPALIPIPWDASLKVTADRPLKIAVMWHDGVVMPHPPVQRALREVVSRLQDLPNVSVIDWTPHRHDEAWTILSKLFYVDGAVEDAEAMEESGEPWLPLTNWIFKSNPCGKAATAEEILFWQNRREAYMKEYANLWNKTATTRKEETGELEGVVDAILCPLAPGVAPIHETAKYWGYTSQWNLLDYPALAFPVTKVDERDDTVDESYVPINDADKENWELCKRSDICPNNVTDFH